MRKNPYANLCLAAQALRREFEGVRTPLAPATGVAAFLYTHQLANVFRVLTDLRVRHLLADEVGLGKTVQALMILNALRYQRQDLRVLVIVPDGLVTQWRDEILTRAHSAPTEKNTGFGEGRYIRLAWEDQLRRIGDDGQPGWSLADIDPARYQVLVVDELHSLRSDVQDRIIRMAGAFEHVLALTATPAFQDPKRHAQLFALLEPERTAIARRTIERTCLDSSDNITDGDDFSKWPEQAARAVVEGMIERDRSAAASCAPGSEEAVALAQCAYRRVIRTRRADYGGVLPQRSHIPLVVEPLDVEAERQSLMWRYFGHLGTISRRVDPVLLAKRVILSPPSLQQRVDFLRGHGHDRDGLLEQARPLVDQRHGDSRADALVDLLAEIWSRDATERVLVAAQDNLTVDYLFDLVQARLPVIGPLRRRVPLFAARIRQGMATEAVDDLGGFGNETVENLEAFQRGEAQVLFAPEVVREGLNLQCARILVLYSVPWRPLEVEQWIGRLDRIGNASAFPTDGEAGTVDIYTIVHKGLVDEKVVGVLQCFQAFERSVNLDGNYLDEVAERIEDAALRPERANWSGLEHATEAMAEEDDMRELESALRPHLPWTKQWATDLRRFLESLPPAPIALASSENVVTGPRSWDRAVEGMVKLLTRAREYHIRRNSDSNVKWFQTLWYRFDDFVVYGHKEVISKVTFSFGADPAHDRHPKNAHAFITRRGDIGMPPHRSVMMTLEGNEFRRPLRFLNFGNALHDELVEGWLPDEGETRFVQINLFDDHAFFQHGDVGLYFLRFVLLDSASALSADSVEEDAMVAIVEAADALPRERLIDQMHAFRHAVRCAIEADLRWLRGQLAAEFLVQGLMSKGEHWVRVGSDAVGALLNPMAHGRDAIPRSYEWCPSKEQERAILEALRLLRVADPEVAGARWSHRFPVFDRALETRRHVVGEDGRDAQTLTGLELAEAETRLRTAQDRGNRGQITRAERLRNEAEAVARMTRILWQRRDAWLQNCSVGVRALRPRQRVTAVLHIQRVT